MSEQGSIAWHLDRCGCATASAFSDIIAVSKKDGRPLKAREDYMWKLICDRIYETPEEQVSARSLQWGNDLEPFARQRYEIQTGSVIVESGFVPHPTVLWCGASPDGLIDLDGGIEIKCPKTREVHLKTWLNGMPEEHIPQVQGNLWVTGRQWYDFISFDPRAKEELQLYVQRIHRDEKYILALTSHVTEFLDQVANQVDKFHAIQNERLRRNNPSFSGEDHTPVQRP